MKKRFDGAVMLELEKPITHVLASDDGTGSIMFSLTQEDPSLMILNGAAEYGAFKSVPDVRKRRGSGKP